MPLDRLSRSIRRSLGVDTFSGRFLLREAGGALGDMGTFLPIVIGLVLFVGMDAATILVFAGLMNVAAGFAFGLPVAVQPMKAIAALAIAAAMTAEPITPDQVMVAGLFVGASLMLLGVTDLAERLNGVIPRSVTRGIQVFVAAKLIVKAGRVGLFVDSASWEWRPLMASDGLVVLALAVGILLVFWRRWHWAALGLIGLGLSASAIGTPTLLSAGGMTLWRPRILTVSNSSLTGIWSAGVAQLPLTLLNSVFAVSLLARQLFDDRGRRLTTRRAAVSVGVMNLLACPFGAMPACHGSGGLAGQARFGARTGVSMAILGVLKVIIGLLFGGVALAWMQSFPMTVLAVFLAMAGWSLVQASGFWRARISVLTVAVMLGVGFTTGSLPLAFIAGWLIYAGARRFARRTRRLFLRAVVAQQQRAQS